MATHFCLNMPITSVLPGVEDSTEFQTFEGNHVNEGGHLFYMAGAVGGSSRANEKNCQTTKQPPPPEYGPSFHPHL